MSIATRKGDSGKTALMYNRRVSKAHPRVEAFGCVDELNAAIGLALATGSHAFVKESLAAIQKDLVFLMGELATAMADLPRYVKDGIPRVAPEMTAKLDKWVEQIEAEQVQFTGWAMPGATLHTAALDLARTTCRRAERRVCQLQEKRQLRNPEILVYLNRLADLLWLFARWGEMQAPETPRATG
jgi:cob(I)alamin adenosyltransferase